MDLLCLPTEVLVHALSYLGTVEDLCSVSVVCRTLAEASRDDSLWRPLGHPSWQQSHVSAEGGWKGAYMTWLRAATKQFRNKNESRYVYEAAPTPSAGPPIYSCIIKIVLVGDSGSGKTSLLQRCVKGTFGAHGSTTIGATFQNHLCHLSDETVQLQFWDTAGPERFNAISPMYYRHAHGVLITFDISNRRSFDVVGRYLEEIRMITDERCVPQLIGCKSDLEAVRQVSQEEARMKAKELGVRYAECSAKTGEGVHRAIDELAAYIAGGWRSVYGMETPAYTPDDAQLAARCAHLAGTTALDQLKAAEKEAEQSGYRCSLQ